MPKLTFEKINQLSRVMTKAINDLDEIEIYDEPIAIRQEITRILNSLMREEEEIEARVRQHITSQKRAIAEGGAEWDILYRKYYNDALRKLGVVVNPPDRR